MDEILPSDSALAKGRSLSYENGLFFIFCALVFGYWISSAIYNLFLSPLSSIPGPWYAAISDLWLNIHVLLLRRCRAIDDVLRRYGPIVRIAPNKVIFLDPTIMKHVYGAGSKLSKSSFYKSVVT